MTAHITKTYDFFSSYIQTQQIFSNIIDTNSHIFINDLILSRDPLIVMLTIIS